MRLCFQLIEHLIYFFFQTDWILIKDIDDEDMGNKSLKPQKMDGAQQKNCNVFLDDQQIHTYSEKKYLN